MRLSLEKITTKVSLAVCPKDDFAGDRIVGKLNVSIENTVTGKINSKPIKSLSGYYVFTDIESGIYKVKIDTDYYIKEEYNATISADSPHPTVVSATLIPNSIYPFPARVTLVRGVVTGKVPLEGLTVSTFEKNEDKPFLVTRTDGRGEFAIYFSDVGVFEKDGEGFKAVIRLEVEQWKRQIDVIYGSTVYIKIP